MTEDRTMTLFEHLEELRQRVVKAVLALAVATVLSLVFTERIMQVLLVPAGGIKPIFLRPTEMLVTYMRVGLIAGVGLSMPVILYQLIGFLAPGLEAKEKRYLYLLVPAATLFFIGGVAFAYFFILPFTLQFLLAFGGNLVQASWTIGEYISFITSLLLWVGVAFETPLVIFFLAKVHIVDTKKLGSYRKYAIVGSFVIAAIITPTPDPVTQSLVAIPMILLYELGIILSRFA